MSYALFEILKVHAEINDIHISFDGSNYILINKHTYGVVLKTTDLYTIKEYLDKNFPRYKGSYNV